jgi:hypothetical protein
MIELVDYAPEINVPVAEYARLLGYPRGHALEGRALELAEWASKWYATHGRPWTYARQAAALEPTDRGIAIDGQRFACAPLQQTMRQAAADGVVLVAASAGPEVDAAAAAAWRGDRPDEYFFLEVYGAAVVEHLITLVGAKLCAWADRQSLSVLPHFSPGYPEWDVAEQPRLVDLLKRTSGHDLPARLDSLSSGMLRPKKSQIAVFGLTRRRELVQPLTALSPCGTCCYARCDYRRGPYQGAPSYRVIEAAPTTPAVSATANSVPLDLAAAYTTSAKALARWSRERLSLVDRADGSLEARFRYDGTTCSNMGRPLAFDYTVRLGRRDEGYPIKSQACSPAAGDEGYRAMCRYLDDGDRLLDAIAAERPLYRGRLDDVLAWRRAACSTGCYCDAESRQHKWGLVLETIHFALAERELHNGRAATEGTTR